MPRAIPFRSYGLDLGDSDLPALAQVQKMKQANLIERDLPQRKSTGTGLCEVPKVSLSGFDERRSPVSLDCVRVFEQFFEHDVPPRCWEATSCPSRATEKNMFADRRSTPGKTRDINVAATYDPRQHSPPNIERRGRSS